MQNCDDAHDCAWKAFCPLLSRQVRAASSAARDSSMAAARVAAGRSNDAASAHTLCASNVGCGHHVHRHLTV